MKVSVKTLDRQKFDLELEAGTTVPQLKQTLSERTSLPVAEIRVIFKGKVYRLIRRTTTITRFWKVLKDDKCLGDYVKDDGQTLNMVKQDPKADARHRCSDIFCTESNRSQLFPSIHKTGSGTRIAEDITSHRSMA